MLAKTA